MSRDCRHIPVTVHAKSSTMHLKSGCLQKTPMRHQMFDIRLRERYSDLPCSPRHVS
jgi:hypothetical protein